MQRKSFAVASATAAVLFTQSLFAVTPVTIVAKDGDAPAGGGGATITALNTAYVAGNGKVGFLTTLSDGSRGVFFDTGIVFKSDSVVSPVLTGGEGTMGVSDAGGFAYSPSIDGEDGVYSQVGTVIRSDDAAPGQPTLFVSFASRPRMKSDGTAYWVGGTTTTLGGSSSARGFYRAPTTGGPPVATRILGGGDTLAGATIAAQGVEFPYDVSDDNSHYINRLTFTGATTADAGVVLDGTTMVAREGDPIGGSTWQGFRFVGVNNGGKTLVYGDDASAADDIVVYDGNVVTRQAQVVAGVTLGTTVDAAAINNLGQMIQIWDTTGSSLETLFFSSDAANANATAIRMLGLGDQLDTTGDNVADWTLADFNASATITDPLDFGDDGRIFLDVDLIPIAGGAEVQAIITLNVPEPGSLALLSLGALGLIRRRR